MSNFRKVVEESTSNAPISGVLRVERVRKFSRRAREYMIAYQAIAALQERNGDTFTLSHLLIEKSIKVYKTHRSASDFDGKFIAEEVAAEMKMK